MVVPMLKIPGKKNAMSNLNQIYLGPTKCVQNMDYENMTPPTNLE